MRKSYILLLSAVAVLAGCDSLKYPYPGDDNRIFITADNLAEECLVKIGESVSVRTLTLGIAQPLSHDVKAEMSAAPELFDVYKEVWHDSDIVLLPPDNYEVLTPSVLIPAGNVKSVPVEVKAAGLDTLDMDVRYVLPVTMRSAEGVDILESARTMYFTFKGASLINVVADMNENRAWPDWKDPAQFKDMQAFTLEALVYPNEFGRQISTIMGIEGKFLVRVGDAGVPDNQLQIATYNGNKTSSALQLQTGRWTHVAVVYDYGQVDVYLDGERKLSGSLYLRNGVDFSPAHSDEEEGKPRCFWVGYSYDNNRYFNGRFSEVRIWNRALKAGDINAENHFYTVEPSSSGLIAYWKFDDGAGNRIRDWSVNGNDLTAETAPKWVSVSLPSKK